MNSQTNTEKFDDLLIESSEKNKPLIKRPTDAEALGLTLGLWKEGE